MRYENLSVGKAYIDKLHVGKSATAGRKNVECLVKDITYASGVDVSMGKVPIGATLLGVLVGVRTLFDGTSPLIKVGNSTTADVYMTSAQIAPATAGFKGVLLAQTALTVETEILIDVSGSGSNTAGLATVVMLYTPA